MKVHPAELDEAAAKMAYYYETLRKANDFVDAADIGFDQVIESDETLRANGISINRCATISIYPRPLRVSMQPSNH